MVSGFNVEKPNQPYDKSTAKNDPNTRSPWVGSRLAVTLLAAGSALHGTAQHCRLKAVYKELAVRFNDKKERPKLFEDCRYTYTPPRLLMAKVGAGAPTGERGVWWYIGGLANEFFSCEGNLNAMRIVMKKTYRASLRTRAQLSAKSEQDFIQTRLPSTTQ